MDYLPSQLRDLRREMEITLFCFPRRCCPDASLIVHRNTGLQIVPGYFFDGKIYHNHVWNCDADTYVDLTPDQFDPNLPPIIICQRGSELGRHYMTMEECMKG